MNGTVVDLGALLRPRQSLIERRIARIKLEAAVFTAP